jgi:hypothetical protein
MSFKENFACRAGRRPKDRRIDKDRSSELAKGISPVRNSELEPELQEAIREFRMSVNSWSEAVLSRPRHSLEPVPRRLPWRQAAGWALGCALITASVTGGVYERRQRQESAKVSALRLLEQTVEQSRVATHQNAQRAEEEDLLVNVDSEVSREVPAAMEPLARLMAEDESR